MSTETRERPVPPPMRCISDAQDCSDYLQKRNVVLDRIVSGLWVLFVVLLLAFAVNVTCFAQDISDKVSVEAAKAEDIEQAVVRMDGGNNCYHYSDAAVIVYSTDEVIASKEADNAKLDTKDRKPLILRTSTDQWPYVTYLKADMDCRMTNETFAGQVDVQPTAQLRIYPDGKLADYVDCKAGDIVEVVPFNPHTVPNDGGPRPILYTIISCR